MTAMGDGDGGAGQGSETAIVAGGCFWGVEEIFRQIPGVSDTMVGYIGGQLANPTYKDVCRGDTGHAEAIRITFDPKRTSYEQILDTFFRLHDPTTLNRQHNDIGTQYRSAIYVFNAEQRAAAERSKQVYGQALKAKGHGAITTEIVEGPPFYFAEDYHQQYLAKNPRGYCGIGGTGVSCPVGFFVPA